MATIETEVKTKTDRDILPNDFITPKSYSIRLWSLVFEGEFTFQGNVKINLTVSKSFREITLNAHQLEIYSAKISSSRSCKEPNSDEGLSTISIQNHKSISYDVPKQRVTFAFMHDVPISDEATISIDFRGTINNDMAGFYRSKYKPVVTPLISVPREGDYCLMFSTQFESGDARRAFPCFDEPNLKATFELEVEVPEGLVALSNMPIRLISHDKKGLQRVLFEKTPVMSTYLLAWAIGDFEFIEASTNRLYGNKSLPLPVRIYATRGLKSQGQFALDHATKIVDYYSDIFGIEYPLPKCDLLAVHEFSHGAMENWGLITYRTTALLFDDQNSDARYKNRIAYVVAHELAHQWFGNLVTMDWWNELWLNEGFATWVGWLATDHLHPDWHIWPQFVSEGMQTALALDSLRSSHAIEVPVKDVLDVDQIFDSISYLKGSSVIRMLASYVGQEIFLRGVGAYLKSYAYKNATTGDLWASLSEVSGQNIKKLMDPWIKNIGFPVLTVLEGQNQITVKQSRCLSTGHVSPHEDITQWWVPLGIETNAGTTETKAAALTNKENTFRDLDTTFYKINTDYSGFYRTNYPPSRLALLGEQTDRLNISEKIGLVGDACALAVSGETSTVGLLELLEGFQSENNYLVWSQILSSLDTVRTAFFGDQLVMKGLESFTLRLINYAVEKVGWESSLGDDLLKTQLRALLILTAGVNGHKSVVEEAKRRFDLYMSGIDRIAIHPSLRTAIFGVAIRNGNISEYEALKKEWDATFSVDGKEIALRALGRTQVSQLHDDYLELLFSKVAPQDLHTGAIALSTNATARKTLWKYIQDNFDKIRKEHIQNIVVLDRFLRLSLSKFNDRATEKEIADFFSNKDNRGYDRTLGVVSETILGRAAYKEREANVLLEWLKGRGYIV